MNRLSRPSVRKRWYCSDGSVASKFGPSMFELSCRMGLKPVLMQTGPLSAISSFPLLYSRANASIWKPFKILRVLHDIMLGACLSSSSYLCTVVHTRILRCVSLVAVLRPKEWRNDEGVSQGSPTVQMINRPLREKLQPFHLRVLLVLPVIQGCSYFRRIPCLGHICTKRPQSR